MNLTKSLADLDAAADELLAKSKAAEEPEKDDEKLAPDEISDESGTTEADESEDKDEETEETPEEDKEDVKKSENTEDMDDEGTEDESEPEPEDVEKSFKEDFESDDSIRIGMENSEFYSSVVDILSKSLGDIQYDVQKQSRNQSTATDILAKSLQAVMATNQRLQADNDRLSRRITKLEKSISKGFERIMDSLDDISSQPVGMRKSMSSISVQDRNFDRSLNGQQTVGGFDALSKSQVLDILNNELYGGNPNVTPQDIISYESGAPLKQNLRSLVASKCK